VSTDFQLGCQDHSIGKGIILSTNSVGITGYPHAKEQGWTHTLQDIQKLA
jgi:hypothetical protein